MNNKMEWVTQKKNLARIFLGTGLVVLISGVVLELLKAGLGFDPRIITGLGILLLGIGAANFVRYHAASKNPAAASREFNEERDERMVIIRTRAGNRAFWISIAMTYAILMWESMASNGSLPKLSSDRLWFFLAAAVVLPFVVYIASIVNDQKNY